jgi:hypothetical protein
LFGDHSTSVFAPEVPDQEDFSNILKNALRDGPLVKETKEEIDAKDKEDLLLSVCEDLETERKNQKKEFQAKLLRKLTAGASILSRSGKKDPSVEETDGISRDASQMSTSIKIQTQSFEDIQADLVAITQDKLIVTELSNHAKVIYDTDSSSFFDLTLVTHLGSPLNKHKVPQAKLSRIQLKALQAEYVRKERFIRNLLANFDTMKEDGIITDASARIQVMSDLTVQFSTPILAQEVIYTTVALNPYRLILSRVTETTENLMVWVQARLEYQSGDKNLMVKIKNTSELTALDEDLMQEAVRRHVVKFNEEHPEISVDNIQIINNSVVG